MAVPRAVAGEQVKQPQAELEAADTWEDSDTVGSSEAEAEAAISSADNERPDPTSEGLSEQAKRCGAVHNSVMPCNPGLDSAPFMEGGDGTLSCAHDEPSMLGRSLDNVEEACVNYDLICAIVTYVIGLESRWEPPGLLSMPLMFPPSFPARAA